MESSPFCGDWVGVNFGVAICKLQCRRRPHLYNQKAWTNAVLQCILVCASYFRIWCDKEEKKKKKGSRLSANVARMY